MFLKSSHRGFRALHRERAARSLLREKHKISWLDTCGLFIVYNIILKVDMSYTIYMVCSRFCTITRQNVFFFNAQTAWYPKLGEDRRMSGTTALLLTWKKLCCTLGNGFKSLFFSSDCKVNMERVQNSIQVWTDQNSSFPSAVVVKGHKYLLGGEIVSNSQNTCSRPDF